MLIFPTEILGEKINMVRVLYWIKLFLRWICNECNIINYFMNINWIFILVMGKETNPPTLNSLSVKKV